MPNHGTLKVCKSDTGSDEAVISELERTGTPPEAIDQPVELRARVDFVMRQAGCFRVRLHKEGILHEATYHLCHAVNLAYKKLLPGSILAAFLPA